MSSVPWSRSPPGFCVFFFRVIGLPSGCLVEIDGARPLLVYARVGSWRLGVGGWRLGELGVGGWELNWELRNCGIAELTRLRHEASLEDSLSSDRSSQT